MWGVIGGVLVFVYVAIFSLLSASSRGEETSLKHRADLKAANDKTSSEEKAEGAEIELKNNGIN